MSWATLYLLPQRSISAAILDEWHFPVKKFRLHNFKFMEHVLTKAYHVQRSTEESACMDIPEEAFYKVSITLMLHHDLDPNKIPL